MSVLCISAANWEWGGMYNVHRFSFNIEYFQCLKEAQKVYTEVDKESEEEEDSLNLAPTEHAYLIYYSKKNEQQAEQL